MNQFFHELAQWDCASLVPATKSWTRSSWSFRRLGRADTDVSRRVAQAKAANAESRAGLTGAGAKSVDPTATLVSYCLADLTSRQRISRASPVHVLRNLPGRASLLRFVLGRRPSFSPHGFALLKVVSLSHPAVHGRRK